MFGNGKIHRNRAAKAAKVKNRGKVNKTADENAWDTISLTLYGKERFKNNKTLCHSERSEAQPKNPAAGA